MGDKGLLHCIRCKFQCNYLYRAHTCLRYHPANAISLNCFFAVAATALIRNFFPENEMCLLLSLYGIHGRAYMRFNLIKFRNEVYVFIFLFLSWSVSISMFSSHSGLSCLIPSFFLFFCSIFLFFSLIFRFFLQFFAFSLQFQWICWSLHNLMTIKIVSGCQNSNSQFECEF